MTRSSEDASVKYWRMAMRIGPVIGRKVEPKEEMWPKCKQFGVAAICYEAFIGVDLSQYPPYPLYAKPKDRWAQLSTSQKVSLWRVAYEMKKGDVIYVKQGNLIVGRGVVTGSYRFDKRRRVVDIGGNPWEHQVPVKWDQNFQPIQIQIGRNQQFTVEKLTLEDVKKIRLQAPQTPHEFPEGADKEITKERRYYRRNRKLKEAVVKERGYSCEACKFNFGEFYGDLGYGYIEIHHLKPLSKAKGKVKTSPDDVRVVCANCHRVLHRKGAEPISFEKLCEAINQRHQ